MTINEAPIGSAKPKLAPGARQRLSYKKDFEVKYVPLLEKHCKIAIAAFKKSKHLFYRGSKNRGMVYIGRSVENRRTKDMPEEEQTLIDNTLRLAGFKALRSNSIFVTSKAGDAAEYGKEVYIIFPIDVFNFTWSSKIGDLYSDWDNDPFSMNSKFRAVDIYKYTTMVDRLVRTIVYNDPFRTDLGDLDIDPDIENEREYTSADAFRLIVRKLTSSFEKWQDNYDYDYEDLYVDDDEEPVSELWRIRKYHIQRPIAKNIKLAQEILGYLTLNKQKRLFGKGITKALMAGYKAAVKQVGLLKELDKFIRHIEKLTTAKPKSDKAKSTLMKMGFKNNEDLVGALRRKNEVYINGSYYAFNVHKFQSQIRSWLGIEK